MEPRLYLLTRYNHTLWFYIFQTYVFFILTTLFVQHVIFYIQQVQLSCDRNRNELVY